MIHKWHRVTKTNPCPICKRPDWCTLSDLGACCMRVQSDHPTKNGGWLHKTTEKQIQKAHYDAPPPVEIDAGAMIDEWSKETPYEKLKSLAAALCVSAEALAAMNCCWSPSHQAWAFPMRDGSSRIIGIRLRYPNGEKRSVRGSRNGLFIPMSQPSHPLFICEGPTDAAAALTIGLFAIGRPSCSGGAAHLYHAVKERRIRRAIIVADNDSDKPRPDGTTFNPGFDGASRLADELGIPSCLLLLPAKDIREYVSYGGDRETIEMLIGNLVWHQPKNKQPEDTHANVAPSLSVRTEQVNENFYEPTAEEFAAAFS